MSKTDSFRPNLLAFISYGLDNGHEFGRNSLVRTHLKAHTPVYRKDIAMVTLLGHVQKIVFRIHLKQKSLINRLLINGHSSQETFRCVSGEGKGGGGARGTPFPNLI